MKQFTISHFNFSDNLEQNIQKQHADYLNWPLVYFLKNDISKNAYIGETTDVLTRLKTHQKNALKQELSSVNIVLSDLFNKSATLDLESNLIRYVSADGEYKLQNGNLGIANHRYYNQKEVYWELFNDIWDELRSLGIARHSLDYIDNSDLFKYSPYKSLSKEQVIGLKTILYCLLDENSKTSLIQGGAGTGKSILAIFLFKLLKTNLDDFNYADFDEDDEDLFKILKEVKRKYGNLNMALVVPMTSFRHTVSNVFKNIKGLSKKMVIGPSDISKQKYDLLIVDEGHRLRQRQNLTNYKSFDDAMKLASFDPLTKDELDLVEHCSEKAIIFYDPFQSIKPTDVLAEKFNQLKNKSTTRTEKLKTQFRVKGGNEYVKLIHDLFDNNKTSIPSILKIGFYDFQLFENLDEMLHQIQLKEEQFGLSRLVAGFSWEYKSKKDRSIYDIQIGSTSLRWNSTEIDWVNSSNAINEVGCIHTTQGYDLNYTGVIIGTELDYDFKTNQFIVYKENYKDKNGKNSIKDSQILLNYIINIYKTILLRGIEGTYIYVCNPNLRKYFSQLIPTYNNKTETKISFEILDTPNEFTIPYYDLEIAAGSFSDQQIVDILSFIELPDLIQRENYFACKVIGESMNKIIPNGSICLFKKYSGGTRNGLITLVESSNVYDFDFGAQYTIKEYMSKKTTSEEGWQHEEIILMPKSEDSSYENIILKDEETIDLRVIGEFIKILSS